MARIQSALDIFIELGTSGRAAGTTCLSEPFRYAIILRSDSMNNLVHVPTDNGPALVMLPNALHAQPRPPPS